MKRYDRYTLLFNQLWQIKPELVKNITINMETNLKTVGEIMQDNEEMVASLLVKAGSSIKRTIDEESDNKKRESLALFKAQPVPDSTQVNNVDNSWNDLINNTASCNKCNLSLSRKCAVVERGNRHAQVMFVGEAPSTVENDSGIPFVGASGELLDKMIVAMQLDINHDVYICNAIKCMPLASRNPDLSEIAACRQYLLAQIALVKPKVIIALGHFASVALLEVDLAVEKLRGSIKQFNDIPVIVTYSPAYLLRNTNAKKEAWVDLQLAMQILKK